MTSSSSDKDQVEEDVLIQWLEEIKAISGIMEKISESGLRLGAKRVTLEEKLISRYLFQILSIYGNLLTKLGASLANRQQPASSDRLAELQLIDSQLRMSLDGLLKIINYDLNFLEQYYEHGFFSHLSNEGNYLERLTNISRNI